MDKLTEEIPVIKVEIYTPAWDEYVQTDASAQFLNKDSIKKLIRYPAIAPCAQGKVLIKILVDIDGKGIDFKVIKSPHQLFVDEVVKCLPYMQFSPALFKGKRIRSWIVIPFDFTLH